MQAYQINELEQLTGIKAHTIRIWEKRYSLIKPSRTATNRRYYSDAELRKLLNVSSLLSKGHKISKIAGYTEKELNDYIEKGEPEIVESNSYINYVNDLLKYTLVYDHVNFERVFTSALQQFGVYETVLQIIYPFIYKTGILWSVSKAVPVQEHFASCLIRQKIIAITDTLPPAAEGAKKFLLFLPPGEWHEIGLFFAQYIIRSNGHECIYLGQNVPIDNVGKVVNAITPGYLLLFYITARPKEEITKQVNELAAINKKIKILVAGNKDILPVQKSTKSNITYLQDVNGLMDFI